MKSVRGLFDGKKIHFIDKVSEKIPYKVIITFIEEIGDKSEDEAIRNFSSSDSGFDFWNDEREDIYQDFLKVKAKK